MFKNNNRLDIISIHNLLRVYIWKLSGKFFCVYNSPLNLFLCKFSLR